MSRRKALAGASTLAITVALSLGLGDTARADGWTGDSYSNTGTVTGGWAGVSTPASTSTLTNSGLISASTHGIVNSGTIGALSNSGTITGGASGIYEANGDIGTLSNDASGTIRGNTLGINNHYGTIGTLANDGSISGGVIGVYNNQGSISALNNNGSISGSYTSNGTISGIGVSNFGNVGTLGNNTGGAISGGATGVENALGLSIGTLSNSGTITGGTIGVLNAGTIGLLDNQGSGTIGGGRSGIDNAGNIGTLSNAGLISGAAASAISNTGSIGTLSNSGIISSSQSGTLGIGISNRGDIGALNNSGTISGDYSAIANTGGIGTLSNSGVISTRGIFNNVDIDGIGSIGTLTNESTGTISGGAYSGIGNAGSIGTLSNSGSISGNNGIFSTYAIDELSNSGAINGDRSGVGNIGSIGTLTNSGTISGGTIGVANDSGTIGTLTNSGSISGGTIGVVNLGTMDLLENRSGGGISGSYTSNGTILGIGVANRGSLGTLSNSGSISGGSTGIGNDGSIGTLTNSGTISGDNTGINNASGTIGTLINSGTVDGGTTGVYNDVGGSIGVLNNSSTITAGHSGVSNDGTIGTLTNSGVIDSGDTANGTIVGIGVSNRATIGLLNNSGTVNGGTIGVRNEIGGSIGALNNSGTISADRSGISNDGTIGTLTNSGFVNGGDSANGTISGTGATNRGTISLLSNSGTVTGGTIGVYINHSGNIGALNNSGTISAGHSGVSNDGTIGTLTNSGVIDSGYSANGTIFGTAVLNRGTISAFDNEVGGTIHGEDIGFNNDLGGNTDTLTNSGSINGGTFGVANAGTIGTLTNESTGSISGSTFDVYNKLGGSIGALRNRGTISGGLIGVTNLASIGTLDNSGIISSNASAAIGNLGSIGTLTNSGTISALSSGGRAIYNSFFQDINGTILSTGSIDTIVNEGVIAGEIFNNTANVLTFSGGTGTVFGTLTGVGGSIGSIINTQSALVFLAGNLLLNDHINATGHTVSNSGATLRLDNTVTITGTYSQNGGGLISTATANGASYGMLVVDGDASVSNATITVSGAGLSAGQTFTIVDATGAHSGTYTSNTATVAVTNGLGATVSTVGNDLVLTLTSDSANTYSTKGAAAGGTGSAVGRTLDAIRANTSPTALTFQSTVLDVIDALPSAAQGGAIKQLAPAQVPPTQMSTAVSNAVLGAVEQRQQTAMAGDGIAGIAAGSDARDTTLWGQVLGGGARRGSTAEADGYRLLDLGLATGLDHHFTANALGGVAVSWMRAWTEGSDNAAGSSSILDSYQLTFYGTYRLDRAFIDGQLGFGWNEFDQKRAISFLGSTASAKYSGQHYLAKATVGYDLPLGVVTVTPLASLRWLRSETEAYDETGAGAANLAVAASGANSVTQELGGKVAWAVPTSLGPLTPEVKLAWVHDYTDGPIATSSVLGGVAQVTTTPRTQPDGLRIGLGAELAGDDALTFRVEYEGELRPQYQSHTGLVKALWGF